MTVQGGAKVEDSFAAPSQEEPERVRGKDVEAMRKVCECIRVIYPETSISEIELRELVEESFVAADENYDVQEAIEWGKDFSWPEGVATRDLIKLKKISTTYQPWWRRSILSCLDRDCRWKESMSG